MTRLAMVVALGAILGLGACTGPQYSDGVRTGIIQKLSTKGIFCKSTEGELAMSAMKPKTHSDEKGNTTGVTYSNIWEFSVKDTIIKDQIEAAMASGAPVTLHYTQVLWQAFCSTDTTYIITKVVRQ